VPKGLPSRGPYLGLPRSQSGVHPRHERQCLNIERRDGGPPRSELRTLAHPGIEYDWDQGQLQQKTNILPGAVNHLRANPVLADNVRELRRLQESTRGVVADVYRAKKRGQRPSEEQLRRDAPSSSCTVNVWTPCGSGRMVC